MTVTRSAVAKDLHLPYNITFGGLVKGDLCWTYQNDILWPCLVLQKESIEKLEFPFEISHRTHHPTDQYKIEMDERLSAFGVGRCKYRLSVLPTSRGTVISKYDYEVYPFGYAGDPWPMDDDLLYNRALIQAIQIQSSWAVPSVEKQAISKEDYPINIVPPIKKPIHIGCPSVSGKYLNAKLEQHVIEPKLIENMNLGKEVVDLTNSLLKQGISHWKHTNRQINFHPTPKSSKKSNFTEFPSISEFEIARIGSQFIGKGTVIELLDGRIMVIEKLYCRDNELKIEGNVYSATPSTITVDVKLFKQRFDPCFDIQIIYPVLTQSTWNGETLHSRCPREVNFK